MSGHVEGNEMVSELNKFIEHKKDSQKYFGLSDSEKTEVVMGINYSIVSIFQSLFS